MADIHSSSVKQSTQTQPDHNSSTNSLSNTLDNNTDFFDQTTGERISNNKTTEDKLKFTQSPLDSFLSNTDNLYDDTSSAAKDTSINTKNDGSEAIFTGNGVFFDKDIEKPLGTLLEKSPKFRELYGMINSKNGGWTWIIKVDNSFPVAAGTKVENTIEPGIDGRGVVETYINPTITGKYNTVNGKLATPSMERLIAHEIGHVIGRIEEGYSHSVTESSYDKAIEVENTIMRELDPNAPLRDIHDPLHPSQRPRP